MSFAFRSLDSVGDWTFGKGLQNYAIENKAIILDIRTRVLSFLNDCFFATEQGIDWLNILGNKDEAQILREITKTISETQGVSKVLDASITENRDTRKITIIYNIISIYDDIINGEVGSII